MLHWFPYLLARPLIGLWLATSPHSWQNRFAADDSPHVHASGTDPDRVLLTGDGVATGRGVLTHDLGLAGYLARSLSARTGHAVDVDVVVDEKMTVRSCLAAIANVDLFRFDIIVLSVGANEALRLKGVAAWRNAVGTLLSNLEHQAPAAARIFVLSIPVFGPKTRLPAPLAHIVDQHVQKLNATTATLVAARPTVTLMPVTEDNEFEPESRHVYQRWADGIAVRINEELTAESCGDRDDRPGAPFTR